MDELRYQFEANISTEPMSGCWLWTGHECRKYGVMSFKGSQYRAHRLSWELYHGPIPEGMCVLHHCDVPSCCNPEHLFIGTQADNMHDALKKGKYYIKNRNPFTRLTRDDVIAIRNDPRSSLKVAPEYGVSSRHVRDIRMGVWWKHVPMNVVVSP